SAIRSTRPDRAARPRGAWWTRLRDTPPASRHIARSRGTWGRASAGAISRTDHRFWSGQPDGSMDARSPVRYAPSRFAGRRSVRSPFRPGPDAWRKWVIDLERAGPRL